MKKNYTLIINTSDKYSDLWPFFFKFLKKYWPEFSSKVILNTKSLDFEYDEFQIVSACSGTDHWGASLLKSLELVETEFVLLMFDDFLVNNKISNLNYLEYLSLLVDDASIDAIYLEDITQHPGQYVLNYELIKFSQFSLKTIPKNMSYRVNSAPAIWRADSLRKTIDPTDSPWVWETFAAYRKNAYSQNYFCIDKIYYPIIGFHNDQGRGGAVHQGSWLQSSVDWIKTEIGDNCIFSRPVKSKVSKSSHTLSNKVRLLYFGFRSVGISAFRFAVQRFISHIHK